jgi:integrase
MARVVGRLTPAEVNAKSEKGRYADGAGLYLIVTRSLTKNWAFCYMRAGKAREMGLGPTHTVGLAEARRRAQRARQQLLDGIDPIDAKHAVTKAPPAPAVPDFATVAALFFSAYAPSWKSAVHARQWQSTMRDYVLPVIGTLPVRDVETGAVLAILQPLWHVKPETAARVRQRIEAVLDLASARGWRAGDNPARWRGHVARLLPARSKATVQHHAAMDWQAVPAFMQSLANRGSGAAQALQFAILTAARSSEARGATWNEIDLRQQVWSVPASRMKAGKAHRVPLPAAAVELLRSRVAGNPPLAGELIFPGAGRTRPLSDTALTRLLPPETTLHGFRSSFRTWAAEATGHPREVIETALAHNVGDAVEQAYLRGDMFERRRRLMTDWAAFCTRPAPAVSVVSIRGRPGARRAAAQ